MARKKRFPCGHRGLGKYCHRCDQREAAYQRKKKERQERQALLDASPIPLDDLPRHIQDKALAVMKDIARGRSWQEMGGKIIHANGRMVSIPLGDSYRILFERTKTKSLAPVKAMSHEAYNNVV